MMLAHILIPHINGALATTGILGSVQKSSPKNMMLESVNIQHKGLAASSVSKHKVLLTADRESPGVLLQFLNNRPHRRSIKAQKTNFLANTGGAESKQTWH